MPGAGLDGAWYWATTLRERAQLRAAGVSELADTCRDRDRGQRRLQKWKAQAPFPSGTFLAQRLEQVGLGEAGFQELLSETAGERATPAVQPPIWARALSEAYRHAIELGPSPDPPESIAGCEERQFGFVEIARPLIQQAVRRLQAGVDALASLPARTPIETTTVVPLLQASLPDRLLARLARTMVLELAVARRQGLLSGETPEARFDSFVARLRCPDAALSLLQEYPVLARQLLLSLEDWVDASLEFLQRLAADWPAILATFKPEEDPGPMIGIDGDMGDGHRGGRSVLIVRFHSGFRVVYKPRSLKVDLHFQDLLSWINGQGVVPEFRRLRILDHGSHGWEEFVSAAPCLASAEVERFYLRMGGYLALLYALASTDFHFENIVAAGEHPLLVDLEALFHAGAMPSMTPTAVNLTPICVSDSILGCGLLPARAWIGSDLEAVDLSGLGAEPGGGMPWRSPGWDNSGSDEMRFVRHKESIGSSAHLPSLQGATVPVLEYRDAFENGFRQVYQLLEDHRSELLAAGGLIERFVGDEVRHILRGTGCYRELMNEGAHPDLLRDALERDRLFDRLWEPVAEKPHLAPLIPAEVEDLWRGDIPLFTTRPGSRDVWASCDRCFAGVLPETGLERVNRRLARFGCNDLNEQLGLLRASLATVAAPAAEFAGRRRGSGSSSGEPKTMAVDRDSLLAASRAVGDRLEQTALRGNGDATWIGLSLVGDSKWSLLPLGLTLYDGLPGVALFLAYLGARSGAERYTNLAKAAFNSVRQGLRQTEGRKQLRTLGAFTGWGGILYSMAHLGRLWNDAELIDEAVALLPFVSSLIEIDRELDVIGGAAGCIGGLLALQSCAPSASVLNVAARCGAHLVRRARRMAVGLGWGSPSSTHGPLAGFSHGAAGIAWALLELAAHTDDALLQDTAQGALAYERSLFSMAAGNWPDLRVLDAAGPPPHPLPRSFPCMWCHGAPGIGLARLRCQRHLEDPFFGQEIDVALHTTMADGFGNGHCLCHGDLGNVELFLQAALTRPAVDRTAGLERLTARILRSIAEEGWICGNPLQAESPGLMTGLAGIGYGLLRLAEPERVPAVLTLDPVQEVSVLSR